jgi:hypothetical protein
MLWWEAKRLISAAASVQGPSDAYCLEHRMMDPAGNEAAPAHEQLQCMHSSIGQ